MTSSETNEDTPVKGDGVITIVDEEKEETMSQIDLPPNVASALQTETLGNIQSNNATNRNVAGTAMGVLQLAAARNFDELGAVEGRSVSGLNATPIASPAVQQS